MARVPPNSLEEVRVDTEIGSDPVELDAIADAVVRGCSIRCARITSLRGLIEAVHRHKNAKLAPSEEERGEDWKLPDPSSLDALTHLAIYGGEIADDGDYQRLDIRVALTLCTRFGGDVRFDGASLGGDASFDGASLGGDASFHGTSFCGDASFDRTSFDRPILGGASFDGASFGGDASFDGARFGGYVRFDGARFGGDAQFVGDTRFGGDASFYGARFGGDARFGGASFGRDAWFTAASFAEYASFYGATFGGDASFDVATFGGKASFDGARFGGYVLFYRAIFHGYALFNGTSFGGEASFDGARFGGDASFDGASFAGAVSGDLRPCFLRAAIFANTAIRLQRRNARQKARNERLENPNPPTNWYERFVGSADRLAHLRDRLYNLRVKRFELRPTRWLIALFYVISVKGPRAIWRWLRYEFGWRTVRALGQLQILNRVSVFALIAVPLVVAFWPAVRALAGAYHRGIADSHAAMDRLLLTIERAAEGATLPQDMHHQILEATAEASAASSDWRAHLAQVISESPYIGMTLAMVFFAAVFVTLGQLLYQVFAPDSVRKHDEDEFVDLQHKRYPEDAKDRNDGLRRAIEHLEEIAHRSFRSDVDEEDHPDAVRKRRRAGHPDRHPRFIEHHGDTIWIPPRDRIDWFQDWEPPKKLKKDEQANDSGEAEAGDGSAEKKPSSEPPQPKAEESAVEAESADGNASEKDVSRMGMVPGAERARITIEEGAKAEYWLKSREKVGMAWLSFILYIIGIVFLLLILVIQSCLVAQAAGWWGVEQEQTANEAVPSD